LSHAADLARNVKIWSHLVKHVCLKHVWHVESGGKLLRQR